MSAPAIISSGTSAGGPPVGGSGTSGTIPKWTGATTLGDSALIDNGTAIYALGRNFGIGTASPGNKLDVADATVPDGTSGIRALYTGTITANRGGAINLGGYYTGTTPTTLAYIVGGKDNATAGDYAGHLQFWTRPNGGSFAERARIDSAGNFGIGTASPQDKAQVYGNLKIGVTASDSFLTFGDEGTASRFNGIYRPASSNTLSIGSYNLITFNVSNAALGSQTERARIDSSGNLILNTANTGATIQAAGSQQGLKLPATPGNADSQTLDCYQENTWTPTLTAFDGTAPTVTTAKYTRIGRVVYFEIYLTATGAANFGSTWGNTKISLPFTPSTSVAVPINRNSASSCGATSGSDVFLTTYAQNAESMRVTGFFSV